MQDWVKEKLDQVEALYPKKRVEKSKERWTKLWNGEKDYDRYPFVLYPSSFSWYDAVDGPEERLRKTLDELIVHGQFDDDFIPSLFPGCRQSTIPNILGADEVEIDGDFTCKKILEDPNDVYSLPAPNVDCEVATGWYEMQKYFIKETEGRLPVHVVDMQGPVDAAAQIWSYDDLFVCAYTDPDEYHHLMKHVCDAFSMFWEKQMEVCGEHFVGTHLFGWDWMPPNMGASISADSLAMVSGEFYEEFFKPHLERVSKRFGGLVVHSCGNFTQTIPNLVKTEGVRAINASQLTAKELVDAGINNDTLVIATLDINDAEETAALIKEHDLRMSITFYEPAPMVDGMGGGPQAWCDQDLDAAHRRCDEVKALFAAL